MLRMSLALGVLWLKILHVGVALGVLWLKLLHVIMDVAFG